MSRGRYYGHKKARALSAGVHAGRAGNPPVNSALPRKQPPAEKAPVREYLERLSELHGPARKRRGP